MVECCYGFDVIVSEDVDAPTASRRDQDGGVAKVARGQTPQDVLGEIRPAIGLTLCRVTNRL